MIGPIRLVDYNFIAPGSFETSRPFMYFTMSMIIEIIKSIVLIIRRIRINIIMMIILKIITTNVLSEITECKQLMNSFVVINLTIRVKIATTTPLSLVFPLASNKTCISLKIT